MGNKKNLPNIPLYIGDWEKDCNVLSLEAEAAWLRIIFKLFTNGKQSTYKIPTKGLQNLWKVPEEKVQNIIQELIDFNICNINVDGRFTEFTCRRYVRENEVSEVRKKAVSKRKDRTKDLQTSYKKDTKHLQNTEIENENDIDNNISIFSLLLSFLEKEVNLLPVESASDSRTFHDAVYEKLVSSGYDCSYEYVIPSGRIDILVRLTDGTNVAIELDNRTPRGRNLMKVEGLDCKIVSILRDPYLDKSYQQFNVDGLILYRGFEEKEEPKPKRFNFRKALINYGFREDLVEEWMKVRKAKKSVNTEKSFDDFIRQVEKSGEDKDTLLEFIAVKKQWRGFQAKWLAEFAAPNERLLTYDEVSDLVTDKKKTVTFADFDKKEIDGVMYWIPKKDLK